MSAQPPRLLVTGATGQLGRLVVAELLKTVPAGRLSVVTRDPGKAADLAARGVSVHAADFDHPETLDRAFAGVDRLLMISSDAVGRRVGQHRNAIAAAKRAGVTLLAYTSILHADTTPLGLAAEHKVTEADLRASGVPFVLLRNGWYTENYNSFVRPAVDHGAVIGSAGGGRVSAASRADYAAAAAAVLSTDGHAGKAYELAGDGAFTMAEYAAEVAKQSGKPVVYNDLPEAAYKAALIGFGLPEPLAGLLADSDVGVSKGALFDDARQMSKLIGRPTTPLATVVAAALKG